MAKLAEADRSGVWAFTPATSSALLGNVDPGYVKLMAKRLVDQGLPIGAARGVYVSPHGPFTQVDGRPSEPADVKAAASAIAGDRCLPVDLVARWVRSNLRTLLG